MLRKSKDATFELMDSILTTKNVYSLAELSLCPLFRRKWHSTYEAIKDTRVNRNKMMKRYIEEIPSDIEYVLLGIDNTPWEFKNAKTMKEREYKHQEASKNKVIKGHGYSTIAWLPENENQEKTSWALPLRHERITSLSNQKVSLIKVERLELKKTGAKHKPLWLVWVGEEFLSLDKVWSKYARRFGIDHWYRFAKQRLHWTLPNFSTPHQCERWSDLMPNLTWQLWLARELVEDIHLPWQKPQTNLTPGRVAQSIFPLLTEIGSPTLPPKTRGKSSGCKKGHKRTQRKTYPMVKRRYYPPKKSKKTGSLTLIYTSIF